MSMSTCYAVASQPPVADYTVPLHVDCSVEYELPDCAKPPQGVKIEPLLMIHPCHFRNLERQRRRPFENNLPTVRSAKRRAARVGAPYSAAWGDLSRSRAIAGALHMSGSRGMELARTSAPSRTPLTLLRGGLNDRSM